MAAAAGADLDAFCRQVEEADSTTLEAAIEQLDTTIATQEEELRHLDQKIGTERGMLASMDGSDREQRPPKMPRRSWPDFIQR